MAHKIDELSVRKYLKNKKKYVHKYARTRNLQSNRLDVIAKKKLEKWLFKGNLKSKTGFESH